MQSQPPIERNTQIPHKYLPTLRKTSHHQNPLKIREICVIRDEKKVDALAKYYNILLKGKK